MATPNHTLYASKTKTAEGEDPAIAAAKAEAVRQRKRADRLEKRADVAKGLRAELDAAVRELADGKRDLAKANKQIETMTGEISQLLRAALEETQKG